MAIKILCLFVIVGSNFTCVRPQSYGDIRLVGGACEMQGRLEVFYYGVWGTVCDDTFGFREAKVVCRQLGSSSWSNVKFYTSGGGTGKIWMDNLNCVGTEASIGSCSHNGWGSHNCAHNEDVGVGCFDASEANGNWSPWSNWISCSVTCGSGYISRKRLCDNPCPAGSGNECIGDPYEIQNCQEQSCPVDGGWSSWSDWSSCTMTCNTGHQHRFRSCDSPTPAYGGSYCTGKDKIQNITCNEIACPVNGGWSAWTKWSHCNTTCGVEISNRTRNCDSPEPKFNGSDCIGDESESRNCNTHNCPDVEHSERHQGEQTVTYGTLAGVASACIVITVVFCICTMFVIKKIQRQGDKDTCESGGQRSNPNDYVCSDNATCSETPDQNYESVDRTKPKSGIYDKFKVQSRTFENNLYDAQFEEEVYENLKIQ